jgi:CheY-like chemotaxis protein
MESKPTIMVVDDDPMIGKCLTMFLEGHNYRVIFFTNGQEALAYLANNTVHFLITDLQMPEMTGLELLRQVKTLFPPPLRGEPRPEGPVFPPRRDIGALVMSGSADARDRDEIFALGADFIAKPFELADLLKHIRSAPAFGEARPHGRQCKRIDLSAQGGSKSLSLTGKQQRIP